MPFNRGDRVVQVNDPRAFAATVVSDDGTQATVLGPSVPGSDGKRVPTRQSSSAFRVAAEDEIRATDDEIADAQAQHQQQ
jgi:hypothetical protein